MGVRGGEQLGGAKAHVEPFGHLMDVGAEAFLVAAFERRGRGGKEVEGEGGE